MTKEKVQKHIMERPPIVVVMGHVDHGKTKLLDYIRSTNVVDKEAGGITQHIGAYEIEHNGKKITFLDTPGHEAFSKMRSRGANVADIAVLVVAADEGIKPQTLESLESIQKAGILFLVAVNKIDKPAANSERVRQQMAEHNVLPESWGGTVPFSEISAKTGEGIGDLLDLLLLMAEMEELRADCARGAEGVIIESHKDPRVGMTATLLIRNGSLKVGDYIVVGGSCAKIKNLWNFLGRGISEAAFSSPVKVVGFCGLPELGEQFSVFNSKTEADKVAGAHVCAAADKPCDEDREEGSVLHLIVKADVQGSKEAIVRHIEQHMNFEEIRANVVRADTGDLHESDLKLAQSTGAMILLFNAGVSPEYLRYAETMEVKVLRADIIYELFDAVEKELLSRVETKTQREETGRLQILGVFSAEKDKAVIGGRVLSGVIAKGTRAEVKRGDKTIVSGTVGQLQQNKVDTNEVEQGKECGMLLSGFKSQDAPDVKKNDILIAFREHIAEKTLTPLKKK